MFNISVVHNQYLVIALLGGIVVAILFILGYIAMWIPRIEKNGHYEGYNGGWKQAWIYNPWIVILFYIGIAAFGIWFLVHYIEYPPNW